MQLKFVLISFITIRVKVVINIVHAIIMGMLPQQICAVKTNVCYSSVDEPGFYFWLPALVGRGIVDFLYVAGNRQSNIILKYIHDRPSIVS